MLKCVTSQKRTGAFWEAGGRSDFTGWRKRGKRAHSVEAREERQAHHAPGTRNGGHHSSLFPWLAARGEAVKERAEVQTREKLPTF